jgi:hypothetical protein
VALEILETPVAAAQVDALRGPRKRAYSAFLLELAANGCAAMSYRLAGPEPLPRLCVRHLRGADRVIVAFEQLDRAWVVLVGPHTADRESNIYDLLYRITGTPIEPSERRTKPPWRRGGHGTGQRRGPGEPAGPQNSRRVRSIVGCGHRAARSHRMPPVATTLAPLATAEQIKIRAVQT